jgi:hypothetical protein
MTTLGRHVIHSCFMIKTKKECKKEKSLFSPIINNDNSILRYRVYIYWIFFLQCWQVCEGVCKKHVLPSSFLKGGIYKKKNIP